MKFSDFTIEEIVARHRKGEKVIITNAATFPSDMFPAHSFHTMRIYTGRNETKWGRLITEIKVEITEAGLSIPSFDLKDVINPATGKPKVMRFSFWIVRPDGVEQYTGYQAELASGEPPFLDSLLTKRDLIN